MSKAKTYLSKDGVEIQKGQTVKFDLQDTLEKMSSVKFIQYGVVIDDPFTNSNGIDAVSIVLDEGEDEYYYITLPCDKITIEL